MAFKALTKEQLEEIRQHLGLESYNRPWAAMIDPGDRGTVFIYMLLAPAEYRQLSNRLQALVYKIGEGIYGVVGFVPRIFEPPRNGSVTAVKAEYNFFNQLRYLSYTLENSSKEYPVTHPVRQQMLLEFAAKKKIKIHTTIKSS